jgi:hypothetical protein
MAHISLKQLVPESVIAGDEQDVRGNLGFFDQFIIHDGIKIIDDKNKRTYIWFVKVPLQDQEVKTELGGLSLKAALSDKLMSVGGEGQKIESNVDVMRKDDVSALIRLTLRVEDTSV